VFFVRYGLDIYIYILCRRSSVFKRLIKTDIFVPRLTENLCDLFYPSVSIYRVSEKSGTNENFNYFSYFYLQVKVKG
jgi:hypothetical protein